MQGTSSDGEGIRRTLAGYCQTCDDGRFEDLAALFADDAVFAVDERNPVTGREAIARFMERAQPPELRGKHLCGEPLISIDGDSATVTTDFVFVGRDAAAAWGVRATGRYHDRLRREADGVWRFAERRIAML